MTTFGKIVTVLFFLAYFAVRAVIDIAVVLLIRPVVLAVAMLAGYDIDKIEDAYEEWLFSGRFDRK